MNRKITFQDLREFDIKNLWELQNPDFGTEGIEAELPKFKRRQSQSVLSNYLTPSRLYGVRKLLAWLLWLFILLMVYATVQSYLWEQFNTGQLIMILLPLAVYILVFTKAGKFRLSNWDNVYGKRVKQDYDTYSNPAIIFDGHDMLLANERIFEDLGERSISEYVADYQAQQSQKEKDELAAKKAAEKEKARLKKEKEDRKFKEALEVVGPLIGGGLKNLVKDGGAATRAARAARGTTRGDSIASRAARAARGTTSNKPRNTKPNYVKIEGYTGSYWESCATGLENNLNYIALRMQQIRKSNPKYTKLRAVDSSGRVVDVG